MRLGECTDGACGQATIWHTHEPGENFNGAQGVHHCLGYECQAQAGMKHQQASSIAGHWDVMLASSIKRKDQVKKSRFDERKISHQAEMV